MWILCFYCFIFWRNLQFLAAFWELTHNIWFQAQASICVSRALRWWEKTLKTNMVEIHSAQELVDSLNNAGDRLVIVDFYSPGCGGCKTLHPKVYNIWFLTRILDRNLSKYFFHRRSWSRIYIRLIWLLNIILGFFVRSVSWLNWTPMQFFLKLTMRSSKLCATLSTFTSYHSLGSIEVQRAVYVASAAPMPL